MHALLGAVLLSGLGLAAPPAHTALAAPPAASPLIAENAAPVAVRTAADPDLARPYFGARYYRANIGRFTTTDPVYTWRENLLDPQRWNRYAYARNNPFRYVDPDGKAFIPTAIFGAGVGAVFGFVGSAGVQFVQNDFSFSGFSFRDAGAAALGGAVSGALAGATLGLAPALQTTAGVIAVSGTSNVVGGAVTRAVDTSSSTSPLDVGQAQVDHAFGALGGVGGRTVQLQATAKAARLRAVQSALAEEGEVALSRATGKAAAGVLTQGEIRSTVVGARATNAVLPVGRELANKVKEREQ